MVQRLNQSPFIMFSVPTEHDLQMILKGVEDPGLECFREQKLVLQRNGLILPDNSDAPLSCNPDRSQAFP